MTLLTSAQPLVIAGPCVLEDSDTNLRIAAEVADLSRSLDATFVFKASFDKANRTRLDAPRGPGLDEGLRLLESVRAETGLPVLTDVHHPEQAAVAATVVDVLQVPAFLCRQTDLLMAVGQAGASVNIKKGQWMAASDMEHAVAKVRAGGAGDVTVTERGTFFGYGDLVVDMRNFPRLKESTGAGVIFDATHSVQRPGRGKGGASGGDRAATPALARAAIGAGADGLFIETHPDPGAAPSDSDTMLPLDSLRGLVRDCVDLWWAARPNDARHR